MELIDESLLQSLKEDLTNKSLDAKQNEKVMTQFFYSQNNIYKFISKNFKVFELSLWVKSRVNYINRKTIANTTPFSKKEILNVDFGFNYGNELSYEHPCVVIEELRNKILVVPCSSSKFKHIYKEDGTIRKEYYPGEVCDGFTKQTALLLSDCKWISKNRVVSKWNKSVTNDFFKKMYDSLFILMFETKNRQLLSVVKKKEELDIENKELKQNISQLKKNIEELEKEKKDLYDYFDEKTK